MTVQRRNRRVVRVTQTKAMNIQQVTIEQTALTRFRASVRRSLHRFVQHHAEAFQALTRQSSPYGGNWATVGTAAPDPAPLQQLIALQQRVDELSQLVERLHQQLQTLRRAGEVPPESVPGDWRNRVGINRFRALRTDA
jgi:hypothetical protein